MDGKKREAHIMENILLLELREKIVDEKLYFQTLSDFERYYQQEDKYKNIGL
jgi:hypothetical protein